MDIQVLDGSVGGLYKHFRYTPALPLPGFCG
jgi:hypothetical protein